MTANILEMTWMALAYAFVEAKVYYTLMGNVCATLQKEKKENLHGL